MRLTSDSEYPREPIFQVRQDSDILDNKARRANRSDPCKVDSDFQRGKFALVSRMKTSIVSTSLFSQRKINFKSLKAFVEALGSDLVSITKNERMGKCTEAIDNNMSLDVSAANEIAPYSKIIIEAGKLANHASQGVIAFSRAIRISRIINKTGASSYV